MRDVGMKQVPTGASGLILPAKPSPKKARMPQAISSSITRIVAGAPRGRLTKETLLPPTCPLYNGNRGPHHQDGDGSAPTAVASDLTVSRSQEPTTNGAIPICSTETLFRDAWNATAISAVKRSLMGLITCCP